MTRRRVRLATPTSRVVVAAGRADTAAVRLESGRAALWLGVFSGQQPTRGATTIAWLDGERAADRPDLPLSRLAPVKIGDDGTLLLRAVLGGPSERRTSLLTMPMRR